MMILDILLDHENFVVVNKPAGLLSIPDRLQKEPSLKKILEERYPAIFTVHRLDRDTSGIILFAKDAETHKALSLLFEERQIEKKYLGLVQAIPQAMIGSLEYPIAPHPSNNGKMIISEKGKPSVTKFEVKDSFRNYAWIEFQPYTGRTHQIRLHSQQMGHPLVGDALYGNGQPLLLSSFKKKYHLSKNKVEEKPLLNRLALHAASLKFTFNRQPYYLEAPLPKDLKATLQQLRKEN